MCCFICFKLRNGFVEYNILVLMNGYSMFLVVLMFFLRFFMKKIIGGK